MSEWVVVIKDIIIVLLAVGIFLALRKIRFLKQSLAEEKRKSVFPLLMLELDPESIEMRLKNDSNCIAKKIRIKDIDFTFDMGFVKKLRLRFDPVPMLKPDETVPLSFQVFDYKDDTPLDGSKSLLLQLRNDSFDMTLLYENLEGSVFQTTIGCENKEFTLKEAKPLSDAEEAPATEETA